TGAGARLGLIAASGSTITATNSSITINGQNGSALDMEGGDPFTAGGTINLVNTTVEAVGAARSAARAIAGTIDAPNVLNVSGGSPVGDQSAGLAALSAIWNINLADGAQVTGGNGVAVGASNTFGDGSIVNLTASGSTLTGDGVADSDSTL